MGKRRVLATYFTDATGYRGDYLNDGNYWYAELSNNPSALDFSALGGLPHLYRLNISYNGRSGLAMLVLVVQTILKLIFMSP